MTALSVTAEGAASTYKPETTEAQAMEDYINKHPLVQELRANPEMTESRPHLKLPPEWRSHSLTAGTLMGPALVGVPPFDWSETDGKSYVQIAHVGEDLCGYPGIIHGGFLATMLDEGLARCCLPAVSNTIVLTANLNIDYRAPCKANQYIVLRAKTVKVEGRKVSVEGRLETLVEPGETPLLWPRQRRCLYLPRGRCNITWHDGLTRRERNQLRGQRGFTIWFTGLSASGKSTVATALEQHLLHLGLAAYRLDGDNVRFGLNKDLGFSEKDRNENIRRIAEVAKLFADSSVVALTSFISPYRADRQTARELHAQAAQKGDEPLEFVEVYVDIPIEVAEQRDPKGLYKKARAGEIKEFTGISAPYEAPENPEITIKTHENSVEECVAQIVKWLQDKGLVKATP
ncbi:hypothetical protein MCOR01_004159 [Pyricularia oryzae]|nr:hypothetical protein MCOR01_004159 [Pyricularia oryzae]